MSDTDSITFRNDKFGEVTVNTGSIVTFPEGVPGFERFHRYGLVSVDEEAPFLRLLSVDEPSLGFVILNPRTIWADYNPKMGPEDLDGLKVREGEDVDVYCIVTLSPVPEEGTVNLKGPIAINTRTMTARQVILMDDRYTTKHSLIAAGKEKVQSS